MVEPNQGQESEHDQRGTLRRLSLVELLSVIFNAVLAVTAIAGSCFLYRQTNATEEQLKAMRGQLAEMKGGSADTHNLAAATGSYASDMKHLTEQTTSLAMYAGKSAVAMGSLVARTTTLADQTTSLAQYAGYSADAAKIQATGIRDLAIATKRAYQITNKPSLAAYPSLTAIAGELPTLFIEIVNNGNAPAVNVQLVPSEIYVEVAYTMSSTTAYIATTTTIPIGVPAVAAKPDIGVGLSLPPPTHGREEGDLPKFFGLAVDPNEQSSIPIPDLRIDQFKGMQPEWLTDVRHNPQHLTVSVTGCVVRYEDLFGGVYTVEVEKVRPSGPSGDQNHKHQP
ncbi:MAG TPA: hypothetical protein VLC46_15815 [Thermoanaerobaculia bacterium]|jgi:hypothetical protein|nr:hypothetical protein [Thermoanaerobaculia bacterium]